MRCLVELQEVVEFLPIRWDDVTLSGEWSEWGRKGVGTFDIKLLML